MAAPSMEIENMGLDPDLWDPMKLKFNLLKDAMSGNWNGVVNRYEVNPGALEAKITRAGDTALHMVISDNQEDIVEKLVSIICEQDRGCEALRVGNNQGNTPLHLAASMGNVRMCKCIAKVDQKLVGVRNGAGETPFFLAALHGQQGAFLCLHTICGSHEGYSYSRNENGDTILHCAIAGDYFDLASQIILRYEGLVNCVNQQGNSPLQLLASKPSVFKSSCHISGFKKIIYDCMVVDKLKEEAQPTKSEDQNNKYPENYETCINFFLLLRNVIRSGTTNKHGDAENPQAKHPDTAKKRGDAENSQAKHLDTTNKHRDADNPRGKYSGQQSIDGSQGVLQLFLSNNYGTFFEFIKLVFRTMLVFLGLGFTMTTREPIYKKKQHTWSVQIMNELLERTSMYEYQYDGKIPQIESLPSVEEPKPYEIDEADNVARSYLAGEEKKTDEDYPKEGKEKNLEGATPTSNIAKNGVTEMVESILGKYFPAAIHDMDMAGKEKNLESATPILIAAKNGVMEMVEKILEYFPAAIHDMDSESKNIVLLAVENRKPDVYQLLLNNKILKYSVFRKVDNKGNCALHLASKFDAYRPWLIPSAALQLQWEIKWYEFIKDSMPPHFFVRYNNEGKTPEDILTETHKDLITRGGQWLSSMSKPCSVVAGLITTVAFTTSATLPGGVQTGGSPALENKQAFKVFAISSFVALYFSSADVVAFLTILTSRYEMKDFRDDLPRKLMVGFTALLISIVSMLISFCAGHYFIIQNKLQVAAVPVYIVACGLLSLFAINHFSLYLDVIWANFKTVPQRS